MADKLGVEALGKVVKAVAQCANVFSKLINKQGIIVLLGLQEPVTVLGSTDWAKVAEEVKDLSPEERKQLEAILSAEFQPVNPAVDVGLDKFLAIGEKTASVIEKGVSEGKEVYESVKELIAEWKAFLGVA